MNQNDNAGRTNVWRLDHDYAAEWLLKHFQSMGTTMQTQEAREQFDETGFF